MWARERCCYLSNKGDQTSEVKGFYFDNGWLVLIDYSMCMIAYPEKIAGLSSGNKTAITVTTQGTAGVAIFQLFQDGKCIREINGYDGKIEYKGSQIAFEQSRYDIFYLEEIDELWKKFGLSSILSGFNANEYWGHEIVDETDYSKIIEENSHKNRLNNESSVAPLKNKVSWWKFW